MRGHFHQGLSPLCWAPSEHPSSGGAAGPWSGVSLPAETLILSLPTELSGQHAPCSTAPQLRAASLHPHPQRAGARQIQPPGPHSRPSLHPSYLPCLLETLLVGTVNDINLPWGQKGQSGAPSCPAAQPFCGAHTARTGLGVLPHSPAGLCCPDTSSSMGGWSAAPRYPKHSASNRGSGRS